jgi:PAS domain S-box-containing protein
MPAEPLMKKYITKIKAIEHAVEDREKLFGDLENHFFGVLYLTDTKGIITCISSRVSSLFGYSADEMTGSPFITYLPEHQMEKALSAFQTVISENKPLKLLILEMKHKSGWTFFGELNAKTVKSNGTVLGTIGIIRDVSSRIKQEEELARQNRLLKALNEYSLKLANIPKDQLLPYISQRLKDKFSSKLSWISFYRKESSELVTEYIAPENSSDPVFNDLVNTYLAGARIPLNHILYRDAIQEKYLVSDTLETFLSDSVPAQVCKKLTDHLNADWFLGVALIHEDELTGALFISGGKNHPVPGREDVLAFAGVTANAIKRMQAEEALHNSKERFRKLVKHSSDFLEILDKDGNEIFVSGSVETITGYKPEEVVGSNAYNNIHPDDIEMLKSVHRNLLHNPDTPYRAEYRLRCADDTWKHLEAVGSNFLADPLIEGVIVNVRDITDRKLAEEKLKQSEELYRLVVQNANDMIVISQGEYIVFANRKTMTLLGYSETELFTMPFPEMIHPEDQREAMERYRLLLTGIVPPKAVMRVTKKSGDCIYTEVSGIPVFWNNAFSVLSFISDITDRYAMEQTLRNSEQKFRTYFEKSPLVVAITDDQGVILDINPAIKTLDSNADGKLIGTNIFDQADPDLHATLSRVYNTLATDNQAETSLKFQNSEGRVIWFDTLITKLEDRRYISFSRDVTSQRYLMNMLVAQKELAVSVSRADTIQDILNECLLSALCVSETECGSIYLINPITGKLELKVHTGLSESFVKASASFEPGSECITRVNQGKPLFITQKGDRLPFSTGDAGENLKTLAVIPITIDSNTIGCLNIYSRTLSTCQPEMCLILEAIGGEIGPAIKRQQIASRLKEREENLNIFFNTVQDALFILNGDGQILELNPKACRLLGYEPTELYEYDFIELHQTDQKDYLTSILKDCNKGKPAVITIPMITKNNETVPIETHVTPGRWNSYPALFAVSRDISERIRAENMRVDLERQLLQSQKLESMGIMAGGVAHDFNNILMAMLGHVELSLYDPSLPAPARTHLSKIQNCIRHATELTRQMLTYAGKASYEKDVVSIRDIIDSVTTLMRSTIQRTIKLVIDFDSNLPVIYADPGQLHHVLMNLIINATEAIGSKTGVIKVTVDQLTVDRDMIDRMSVYGDFSEGHYVQIAVTDTGCGMDSEMLTRIFEPFFTTKFTGRGLGLASILGIIKGHDGCLGVSSQPGVGSTFDIYLPVYAQKYHLAQTPEIIAVPDFQAGGTILIADDDKALRELFADMLKTLGFCVLLSSNGVEAVEIFKENSTAVDCVLLDVTMPEMSGFDALRNIRDISGTVKIIMVSGYSEESLISNIGYPQIDGFLSKPFTFDQLKTILRQLLNGQDDFCETT